MARNTVWLLCAALASASGGFGQTAQPTIESVQPKGALAGSTIQMTIQGRNLDETSKIVFLDSSLAGTIQSVSVLAKGSRVKASSGLIVEDTSSATRVVASVTIPADVRPGRQIFRLVTPLGTTNLAGIDVHNLPAAPEREPNNLREQAQNVTLPATIEGKIEKPGDVDLISFSAQAGEELVFDLMAQRLDSGLDGALTLLDSSGKEIAASITVLEGDPCLYHRFDRNGTYFLRIADQLTQGSEKHFYRLHAGKLPLVTQAFPRGLRTGVASTVKLDGVNLPAPTRSITPGSGMNSGERFFEDGAAFVATRYPTIAVEAPGHDRATAIKLGVPVAVNSRIESAQPSWFRFSAKRGQTLYFDVFAQRLRSPLDSVIEVRDSNGNPVRMAYLRATTKTTLTRLARVNAPILDVESIGSFRSGDYGWINGELLRVSSVDTTTSPMIIFEGEGRRRANMFTTSLQHPLGESVYRVEALPPDQAIEPRGLPVFELFALNDDGGPGYGSDSHLEFKAPSDGDYFLTVRDVRGLSGPGYAYVMTVSPKDPDFRISVSPANPNLPAGGRIPLAVTILRTGGFVGPVDIRFDGLPTGVRALATHIPQDQSNVTIALEGDPDAREGVFSFRAIGTAEIGGRRVERVGDPNESSNSRIAAGSIPRALSLLSVIRSAPDVVVSFSPSEIVLEPGAFAKAKVTIKRAAGFNERVLVRMAGLPLGVFVRGTNDGPGIVIHEKETEAEIEIEADRSAPAVERECFATGTVETNSPIPQRHISPSVKLKLVAGQPAQ